MALGATSSLALALPLPLPPKGPPQDFNVQAASLGIGDPAPRLKLGQWVKGKPVVEFERDQVYVVDFWATWCTPANKSIPMLSDLERKYAEKGVRVLGVSVFEEKPCDVAPFVERQGERMSYSVACDLVLDGATASQGAMALTWLKASGETSLPTAFIVDRAGRIVWIGDSMSVAGPLEQVVAGTWDLEAAKSAHALRARVRELRALLNKQVRTKAWAKVLDTTEEMRVLAPETERSTIAWRFRALIELGRDEEAHVCARNALDTVAREDAYALNIIAWTIVDPTAKPRPGRDLDLALSIAERATELTERQHPGILDTLATVHFERGALQLAVATQEEAVRLAAGREYEAELRERLERFRKALQEKGSGRVATR
jgi:thiol-disulfide isomerase/thioredoxin